MGEKPNNQENTEQALDSQQARSLLSLHHPQAENEFTKFFNLTPDLACIATTAGRFLKINSRWQEKLGYPEHEILSTPFLDFVHPEDKNATIKEIERLKTGKKTIQFVNRYRCKGSSYILLEWSATPDADGTIFSIARDITGRKQIEDAVLKSEGKYRSLFENMLDGVAHCRIIFEDGKPVDMEYLAVNPAFEQITGLKDLVGRRVNTVIPGYSQNNPESIETFGSVAIDGKPRHWEHYLADLDRWFYFSIYSPANGEVVIVSNNITERKKKEWQLQQMAVALNCVKEQVIVADENSHFLYVNDEACQALGYTREELLDGRSVLDISGNMTKESWLEHWQYIKSHGSVTFESNQRDRDGNEFPVEVNANYFKFDGGDFTMGLVRDITERKKSEAAQRIAAVAFESLEGMTVTDANRNILRVNTAFTSTTGYTQDEVVGKNPRILSSGRHNDAFYAAMWESINSAGSWKGEIWNRRKNGEVYPEYLTITAIKDGNGIVTNYLGSFIDITSSKKAEEEIKHLAFYDALTLLPNRRLLLDRLKQALASCTRTGREGALLFIDLDNFNAINDTLGHEIGDLLLQQVALRLGSCIREGDTVARIGGDDFIVVLEELSNDSLEAAAQTEAVGNKILSTLNQPYQLSSHELNSTPSIGATLFNYKRQSIDELMKQADIAMYQAKKEGRNTLRFFDPQMQDALNNRSFLESELRKALEKKQFHLYYQIQVDGIRGDGSHAPLGAEALIRWIHPKRGLVLPDQFIPLAEESGVILSIGQWVLEAACAQIKEWQRDALTRDLVLSINVSAKQLRQAGFVDQVNNAIQHYAINPMLLKLELTESSLLENIEETIATMNTLNKIGIMFSLDDFGTGYSSLQYLKRLPLHQLKIDRSFVREITVDNNDKAIVRTIIAMAKSLNLNVIAEGVETEEQQQLLLKKGCAHYQGYLFGKAVPIEQFEASLKQVKPASLNPK